MLFYHYHFIISAHFAFWLFTFEKVLVYQDMMPFALGFSTKFKADTYEITSNWGFCSGGLFSHVGFGLDLGVFYPWTTVTMKAFAQETFFPMWALV